MLILAGVALNIVLGDNGIFKKSKDSAQRYTESSLKEEISLLMGNWYMENTENEMALEDFLDAKKNDKTIEDYYKEDTDYVIVKDGYETIVDQNGNIVAGPDKIDIPGMYRIRFEAKGGSLNEDEKKRLIKQGDAIGTLPTPGQPTAQSYFDGWYLDKDYTIQATSTTEPTGNITIYAKWRGPWRITYNLNGGTQQETEKYVARESLIGTLPVPTRAHHKFLGWYSKADFEATSKVDENTEPEEDMELYAKWEAQCKITFNANGGECSETERYVNKNASIGTLPTISTTKGHSTFISWYTNSSYTTQATANTKATSDMEIYARWEVENRVSSSNQQGTGYSANYAFDGVSDSNSRRSAWVTQSKGNSEWIMIEYYDPVKVNEFSIENLYDGYRFYITNFYLQGSNNGTSFTNLYTGSCNSGGNYKNTYTLNNSVKNYYKYYRILITSNYGDWIGISEIEFKY